MVARVCSGVDVAIAPLTERWPLSLSTVADGYYPCAVRSPAMADLCDIVWRGIYGGCFDPPRILKQTWRLALSAVFRLFLTGLRPRCRSGADPPAVFSS